MLANCLWSISARDLVSYAFYASSWKKGTRLRSAKALVYRYFCMRDPITSIAIAKAMDPASSFETCFDACDERA